MNMISVKPPVIQDRLENDFPASPLVQQVNALIQGNLTNEEFAAAKQSYLTYLIADRVYNQYLHHQHGIRRRQYLQHIHGSGGGVPNPNQGGNPVNTGNVGGSSSSSGAVLGASSQIPSTGSSSGTSTGTQSGVPSSVGSATGLNTGSVPTTNTSGGPIGPPGKHTSPLDTKSGRLASQRGKTNKNT